MQGIYKTDSMCAGAAALALLGHGYSNPRHSRYLGTDPRCGPGKDAPETTARATVADSEKFLAGPHIEPDRIKFIAADQMNQPCLTTPCNVFECLILADQSAKSRINPQHCLSEEKAPQSKRVIHTPAGIATDTEIHNPMVIGLLDKMLRNLRGHHHAANTI